MSLAVADLDEVYIRHLKPLNSLSAEVLGRVMANSKVERIPPGRRIFSAGDEDLRTIFLLSGQLALMSDESGVATIRAESAEATLAIADHQPRKVSAIASTSITILSIDTAVLGEIVGEGQARVAELQEADNLSATSKDLLEEVALFKRLPVPHQKVLQNRVIEIRFSAGDVVVKEGDSAEYYYIVLSGCCRAAGLANSFATKDLGFGDSFGDDALFDDSAYLGTVTMVEDGLLLRLHKGEFFTLIVSPFVDSINSQTAEELLAAGAILLDIRSSTAFLRQSSPNSINLPLRVLRDIAVLLNPDMHFIVTSNSRRRSAMAAFILAKQNAKVSVVGCD